MKYLIKLSHSIENVVWTSKLYTLTDWILLVCSSTTLIVKSKPVLSLWLLHLVLCTYLIPWCTMTLFKDLFESCLKQTIRHFITITMGFGKIHQIYFIFSVAITLLRGESWQSLENIKKMSKEKIYFRKTLSKLCIRLIEISIYAYKVYIIIFDHTTFLIHIWFLSASDKRTPVSHVDKKACASLNVG